MSLPTFNRWRWRFVNWGFRQLYTNFAWAYDAVAWSVSRGHWTQWGRAALDWVEGPRVLEVGSGPGYLLAAMATAGLDAYAIDLSPQMVRIAQGRLRRRNASAGLVRGRAQGLPWRDACFDSVVMTFPTGFALQDSTLAEVRRVLRPEGWLIIVDGARLREDLYGRIVNLAFRLTGGSADAVGEAMGFFERAGFSVSIEEKSWPASSVTLVVATKKNQRASLRPIKRSPLVRQGG